MHSVLKKLQESVARHLSDDLSQAGAVVLARSTADLESQVEAAIQSSLGLSVIILDPCPRRVMPAVPGPVFLEIALTIRVIENLLINATDTGLLAAAERTCQVLHLWSLPVGCGEGVLQLMDTHPWTTPTGPLRGAVAVDLHFVATGSLAIPQLP